MKTIIYHNQSCSKSCASLEAVQGLDPNFEVVEYLENPPTAKELKEIIALLGISPEELVRKNEFVYIDNFKDKTLTDDQWIQAMADFPELIERPIVIHGNKAAIGRPIERVIELFK
jgi:arsenate reductase